MVQLVNASAVNLQSLIQEWRELQVRAQKTYWRMGKILQKIYDSSLWVGNGYSSFQQLVEEEFDVTLGYAAAMMKVTKEWTEEEAGRLGLPKCRVLFRLERKARRRSRQLGMFESSMS